MIRFVLPAADEPLLIDRHTLGTASACVVSGSGPLVGVVARAAPASLWVALEGGLRIEGPDRAFDLATASIRVIEAGAGFTVRPSAAGASRWIGVLLSPAIAGGAWTRATRLHAHEPVVFPVTWERDEALAAAAARLAASAMHGASTDSNVAREALLGVVEEVMGRQTTLEPLVARCGAVSVAQRRRLVLRLLRAREVLDAGSGPASVAAAARAASVSIWHLSRLFRRVFGVTPAWMLRRRRLAAARDMLVSGRVGVAEVVRRLGFRNRCAFARAFRAAFGHPPSRSAQHARAGVHTIRYPENPSCAAI